GVAFSSDGTRVATGSDDRMARIWDARSGTPLLDLKGHTGQVTGVAFSPDGTRIVTGGGVFHSPGEAKVWDAQAGTLLLDLRGHTGPVMSVVFSPDGTRIVTAGLGVFADDAASRVDRKHLIDAGSAKNRPGQVKVWDSGTGKHLLDLELDGP